MKAHSLSDVSLNLEGLTEKYNSILAKYAQVHADYTDYLVQHAETKDDDPSPTPTFEHIPRSRFLGQKRLRTTESASAASCSALCAADGACSGATFASSSSQCMLRSGPGKTSTGGADDTAIVPKSIYYLSTLKSLNESLEAINQQIMTVTRTYVLPTIAPNRAAMSVVTADLLAKHELLQAERQTIAKSLVELESIEQAENETRLAVMTKYSRYTIAIVLLTILVVVIFNLAEVSARSISSSIANMVG